jgi:predicted secreted protein
MDPAAEEEASEGLRLNQGIFKIPKSLGAVGMHPVPCQPLTLQTSHASEGVMVIVTQADNGRQIRVPSGGRLRIERPQAGATGYVWEAEALKPERFEVLEAGTTGRPGLQEIVGAPVTVSWNLRAKKAGRGTELRLVHYRPWEGQANAQECFLLNVQIDFRIAYGEGNGTSRFG